MMNTISLSNMRMLMLIIDHYYEHALAHTLSYNCERFCWKWNDDENYGRWGWWWKGWWRWWYQLSLNLRQHVLLIVPLWCFRLHPEISSRLVCYMIFAFVFFSPTITSSQAPSYASPKLWITYSLTHLLTGVRCRATSVAKKLNI